MPCHIPVHSADHIRMDSGHLEFALCYYESYLGYGVSSNRFCLILLVVEGEFAFKPAK